MEIIYISPTISEKMLDFIFQQTGKNLGFASLKFNRLAVAGLTKVADSCTALCNPPLTPANWDDKYINLPSEINNGIHYHYIPFINTWHLKHICVLLYSFFYVLFKGIISGRKCAIVCDVLSKSGCIGALCASKILMIRSVGVFTDLPWLVVPEGVVPGPKPKCSFLYLFSHYVFLTEQINDEINLKNRPYIVMEGLCDEPDSINKVEKNAKRTILYAGTLMEKYGIKMFVDAFIKASIANTQFVIYGDGPYAEKLKELEAEHDIHYRGLAPTYIVVEEEKKATLLINPRPTREEYTKFSFPSKNMEYMATGTPLLTTRLPGIPTEYQDYVLYLDNETVDGFCETLQRVMSLSDKELSAMGEKAKDFVLSQKNNRVQGNRIINLIKS